jgi:hypothetical protein
VFIFITNMVVQTRLHKKQTLLNDVIENPLLLTTIMNCLDNQDAVNFSLTNKIFHLYDSSVGYEVIQPKLADGYIKFIDEQQKKKIKETNDKFMIKFNNLFRQHQNDQFNTRTMFKIFEHIYEFKDFLFSNYEKYKVFLKSTEDNLIRLIRSNIANETIDAVYFMTLIFDSQPKAERIPGTSDGYVEYITSTQGERIWI